MGQGTLVNAGRGYVHFIVTENGRQSHRLAYGIAVKEAS
jgi:hypothetical protein